MTWKPPVNIDYIPTSEELMKSHKKNQGMKRFIDQLIPPLDDELCPSEIGQKYHDVIGTIRCVLIDINGTLFVGDEITESAIESLDRLRKLGLKICLVANTITEPKRQILEQLRALGFFVKENEVFTSLMACCKLIQEKNYRPLYIAQQSALEDLSPTNQPLQDTNAVVFAITPSEFDFVDQDALNFAFKSLQSGAAFIAVHRDHYCANGNQLALGPGPCIQSLEYALKIKAINSGMPDTSFFQAALETIGCLAEESIIISDDCQNVILGAKQAGLKAFLVQTGKYKGGDENMNNNSAFTPDFVTHNFAGAVRCIENAICYKSNVQINLNDAGDAANTKIKSKSEILDPIEAKEM